MFGRRKARQTNASSRIVGYKERYATWWTQGKTILDQAHILIAGATGCGKSTLIHKLMWTALAWSPSQVQFILIDMKGGVELGRYANLPHTVRFARTLEEALSALTYAQGIMNSRIDTLFREGKTMYDGADTYIVIDELAFLLQKGGQEALSKLIDISQRGRACRIHLLLATQDPSRRGIPAAIQANVTCRIGLKCQTAIESRQVVGVAGCEDLPFYGTGILGIGAKILLLPITPKEEKGYQERIAYWSDPAQYAIFG